MYGPRNKKSQRGFTLLLAALVASITLSLGAAIYSIAIKQLSLSSIGRDSQFAFYAADTVAECALYHDIRLNKFPTSTPSGTYPSYVSCNGVNADVVVDRTETTYANGSQSYSSAGNYTFTVPANFSSLTVRIDGASGGGGSGRADITGIPATGNAGSAGVATTFDAATYGTISANGGGGGAGGPAGGGTGSTGSSGITSPAGGTGLSSISGGTGGPGNGGIGTGGTGGKGGMVQSTYTPTTLPPGTNVSVTVGSGGTGGASRGTGSSAGLPGGSGQVTITWVGQSSVWQSTTFTFQLNFNNDCARVTFTKRIMSGYMRNTIHADGLNTSCSSYLTDPRSLQRSVELFY